MNLSRLADKAKGLVAKRGGTDALKEDADELRKVMAGPGSKTTKAKEAAEALRDPGAPGAERTPGREPAPSGPERTPRRSSQ